MITFAFKVAGLKVIRGKVDIAFNKENKEWLREILNKAIEDYWESPFVETILMHLTNIKGAEVKEFKFNGSKPHRLYSVRLHDGDKSVHW